MLNQNGLEPEPSHFAVYSALSATLKSQCFEAVPIDYRHLVNADPVLQLILGKSSCVTWILDLRNMRYSFMSSNVKRLLGFEAQKFLDGGLPFFNQIVHPGDLHHYWKLLKLIWDFLLALLPWQRKQYRFNCDYRIRKPNGTYVRILEQNSILQMDRKGNITHLLGIGSEISNWKKEEEMVASLISAEEDTWLFYPPEQPPSKPSSVLSKREREVVKLLSEGCSSKYIAERLSISFHTVNTHRQKIIEKTHTKNTGGLIQFAISHGLI